VTKKRDTYPRVEKR